MSPKEYHCGDEDVVAKNKFDPSSTMWNKQSRIIIVVTVALIVLSSYMQKTSFYKKMTSDDKVASNTSTVTPLNEEVEVTSASEPRGFRKFWRSVKHRFQRKRKDSSRQQRVLSDIVKSRVEKLSKKEMNILLRTKENAMDIQQASMLVPWGGPGSKQAWWSDDLIAAYLIIMKFPESLRTKYPFTPCKHKDCSTDFGLRHTLEYRQKYKPWMITPGIIEESRPGQLYYRGISYSGSSIVWFHPGIHKTEKPVVMTRLLMNTLESAVKFSLDSTNGKVGKYFVFLDCDGFRLGSLPPLSDVKKTFRFMQDHMPDRLEKIYLFNLSTAAQLFLNMVTSVLSKEVKEKIIPVPNNSEKRYELLRTVMENKYIPTKFGGVDDFEFDADSYFKAPTATDEEGEEYLRTMPYHA